VTLWTPEQVAKLNEWQGCGWVHEFTCPNAHPDAHQELVATVDGWICPSCDYTQDWAHDFMFNGAPPDPLAPRPRRPRHPQTTSTERSIRARAQAKARVTERQAMLQALLAWDRVGAALEADNAGMLVVARTRARKARELTLAAMMLVQATR
jgi:hypothetical protein